MWFVVCSRIRVYHTVNYAVTLQLTSVKQVLASSGICKAIAETINKPTKWCRLLEDSQVSLACLVCVHICVGVYSYVCASMEVYI